MPTLSFRRTWGLFVLLGCAAVGSAQEGRNIEWRSYAADLASTFYSPADQINASNFNDLEVAWRFSTRNLGPTPEANLQSTPLMVGGVLFSTAGSRRAVVALDATTGELLWIHRLDEGERGVAAPRRLSGRGLTYWDDGGAGQIFYVTPGYRLVALDAGTGQRVTSFGTDGIVDLKLEFDQDIDLITGEVGLHAAPVVAGNTIIIGAAHRPGTAPASKENVKGHVRGYNTRTGVRRWIFHTIPHSDEFGNDSWLNDSWQYTGNTGVWGQISIDEKLNMAYLPVETPTGDYYGGHRIGDNLFANSLVAVDLDTGERVWHFQVSHHDVWDWDLPCAPILTDITVDGRAIKAVALPTKQAWVFVLDRETGEPVWPIEERPVAPSEVPGELLSPTQPFPTKPPAFDRQGIGDRRPDRFHTRATGGSGEDRQKVSVGADLHAADSRRSEWVVWDVDRARRHRRRQLAWRVLRPRDRDLLSVLQVTGHGVADDQRPGAVGHGFRQHPASPGSEPCRSTTNRRRSAAAQATVGTDHRD